MSANRLSGLDTLRGIAALCVLVYHSTNLYGRPLFDGGYLAVDFFFILSGYVMARTYEGRAELSTVRFMQIRIVRLWPLIALGMVLGFFVEAGQLPLSLALAELLIGLTFVPLTLFGGQQIYPCNLPAWSIFSELFANLVHGLLLRRVDTRWLIAIWAGSGLAMAVLLGQANVGSEPWNWYWFPLRVGFTYPLGIALFRLRKDRPIMPLWAAVILFLTAIGVSHVLPDVTDFYTVGFIFPLVLLGGLSPAAGRIGTLVGQMSFPLYAIHYPILQLAVRYEVNQVMAIAVCLAAAYILIWLFTKKVTSVPAPAAHVA